MSKKNPVFAYPRAFYKSHITEQRHCKICSVILVRRQYSYGLERVERYNKRLTCSKKCKKNYISGSGNPNYKGIMPKCLDCGKAISYASGNNSRVIRCQNCHYRWALETDYYNKRPQAIILKKYQYTKGLI